MQESLKAAILKLFPELAGGLHLDRYARVIGIADSPGEGATCERFRPRFAVDIQILAPNMEPDPAFPTYSAVPLPVTSGAGGESGSFSFPEPGALAVVGFAYGRQDHPIIRQIYPMGGSLPAVQPGELLMQRDAAVFQRADTAGNWTRSTDAGITDDSVTRTVKALESTTELAREVKRVSEHSQVEVDGMQTVEVGTVMTLLAGTRADIGTLGTMNLTAGANSTQSTAGNAVATVGGNRSTAITGGRAETVGQGQTLNVGKGRSEKIGADQVLEVGGSNTETASGEKLIEAANITLQAQGTIACISGDGQGGISLFSELLQAIDEIKAALNVLAAHTHPTAGVISQGGAVSGHAANVGQHRAVMGGITR